MEKPTTKYDLEIAHGNIYGPEEEAALLDVLRAGAPPCGKKVKQFEEAFAAYCGVRYALAVTSATTGLALAGIAAGVGPGTEVITIPISWVSTAGAFSAHARIEYSKRAGIDATVLVTRPSAGAGPLRIGEDE